MEALKNKLCKGKFSSMTISWNDTNGPNYETVEDMLGPKGFQHDYYDDDSFVSLDEKRKCIETNSMWTAHWYPNTPVGFNVVHAATFDSLIKYLENLPEVSP